MATTRRAATPEEARALAHPIRLRILRLLQDGSLTNAEMAARLGIKPATSIHHVRTLLRAGFIEADRERAGPNGITEKPYRDTGRSWTVTVGEGPSAERVEAAALDAFAAEVAEAGGRLEGTTRLALILNDADRAELWSRLTEVFDDFAERHLPDGQPFALFVALHRRP
jgi:DNA-binding transcriptional ArsR family regulator